MIDHQMEGYLGTGGAIEGEKVFGSGIGTLKWSFSVSAPKK